MNSQFSGKQSGNIKPRDCRHTPLYGASPNTLSAASLIAHWSSDGRGHLWVLSFVIFSFSKIFSENLLTKLTNCAILYLRRRIMTISPTKTQQSFFRAAEAVASLSNHNQSKLGCVLVDKHRIISSGHNSSTRCSPLQKKMDVFRFGSPDQHKGPVHAETACLLPLIRQGYDMSRSDLYIVRRHRNGSLALSRPCPGCMSLLRANGVRRVFYSIEGGYACERL